MNVDRQCGRDGDKLKGENGKRKTEDGKRKTGKRKTGKRENGKRKTENGKRKAEDRIQFVSVCPFRFRFTMPRNGASFRGRERTFRQMRPDFRQWQEAAGDVLGGDSLWRISAYRFAAYLTERAWEDATSLLRHPVATSAVWQLYRAVGSIGANIAEGYSRSSGADRARFYEYSLGSVRESRHWYHVVRRALPADELTVTTATLDEVRRLLLVMVPRERRRAAHEWR